VTIRHIVALVDPSEPSGPAVQCAAWLAKQCGATLDTVEPAGAIDRELRAAELIVVENPVKRRPQMRSRDRDLLYTLSALAHPTLVVPERPRQPVVPIQRILLATDAAALASSGALPASLRLARALDAEMFVFHAWEIRAQGMAPSIGSQRERTVREGALRLVTDLKAALQKLAPDLTIHMNIQRGPPTERIAHEANRIGADVVALGRGERSAPTLGSVARSTLSRVSCSVLVEGQS